MLSRRYKTKLALAFAAAVHFNVLAVTSDIGDLALSSHQSNTDRTEEPSTAQPARPSDPVAVTANKKEISVSQVNLAVAREPQAQPPLTPGQTREAVIEKLINSELASQRAQELHLDRYSVVQEALNMAKREVMAAVYFELMASKYERPSVREIKDYFDKHPGLFSERCIYTFEEYAVELKPELLESTKAALSKAKSDNALRRMLDTRNLRYTATPIVRSAEQLPLDQLDTFTQMKVGQVTISAIPTGMRVLILASRQATPVSLDTASPAIEMFLVNMRKRALIERATKTLREEASIEYVTEPQPAKAAQPLK